MNREQAIDYAKRMGFNLKKNSDGKFNIFFKDVFIEALRGDFETEDDAFTAIFNWFAGVKWK